MTRVLPACLPCLVLAALSACSGGTALDQHIASSARALLDVEAQGAMRCAPRELAVARSQLEFSRLEREQGFPSRAREHLLVADENVRAARVLSASERCASRPSDAPAGSEHAARP